MALNLVGLGIKQATLQALLTRYLNYTNKNFGALFRTRVLREIAFYT